MSDTPDGGVIAVISTVAGAIAAGAFWTWRKLSPDKTQEREDRAKRDMISRLEHDRDDAWRERDEAFEREEAARDKAAAERELRMVESMRSRALENEALRLRSLIRKVARELPKGSTALAILTSQDVSAFGGLDDPGEPKH